MLFRAFACVRAGHIGANDISLYLFPIWRLYRLILICIVVVLLNQAFTARRPILHTDPYVYHLMEPRIANILLILLFEIGALLHACDVSFCVFLI